MGFKYRPLAAGEIRLLKPVKSKTNTLCYELVHVSLGSRNRYSALSYAWGKGKHRHDITVNNQKFQIGDSLHDFLSQIAQSTNLSSVADKYLWADAVCINQGKDPVANAERSHQVRMMRLIYEKATHVLVWLGKPQDERNNQLAFAKMKDFTSQAAAVGRKMLPIRPWWWPHRRVRTEDIQENFLAKAIRLEQAAMATGNDTHRAWLGINHVWSSAWWTRTWVYQEATVPERMFATLYVGITVVPMGKKVRFICGKELAAWTDLGRALGNVKTQGNFCHFRRYFTTLGRGHTPAYIPSETQSPKYSYDLCRTPAAFSSYRLYRSARQGVRSSLSSSRRRYEHTVPRLQQARYRHISVSCRLRHENRIGQPAGFSRDTLLRQKLPTRVLPPEDGDSFPSWLPNWFEPVSIRPSPKETLRPGYHPPNYAPLGRENEARGEAGYKVRSFDAASWAPCSARIAWAQAARAGRACATTSTTSSPPSGPDARSVATEKSKAWHARFRQPYATGETFNAALCRAMVMDLNYDTLGRPATRGATWDGRYMEGRQLSAAE